MRIKDKYLSLNKPDEAYNIIKTAISNNVDIVNMRLLLKEISSKFEVIKISNSIYQNSSYALPKEVTIDLYDTSMSIPVTWNNEKVDTNNIGTFIYEGYNDDYGRKIIVNVTVIENVYDKQIGSIKKIYSSNGKTYIDVDLVEFYSGTEAALPEAIKDNKAPINENGEYFLPNATYIRNNYSKLTTYEVSNNCTFLILPEDYFLLGYPLEDTENFTPLSPVPFNNFKEFITTSNKIFLESYEDDVMTDRGTLCWIEIKNGVAISIYRQHTA